jgi:tetratricopeptide (TPR) repeat protein
MEKLDLYLAKNDFDNIINLLLSDKRINPSKEIIKKVWDYFEKNENYQVLKDIIERFDDFSPDLNKFKNNINLISDIFLKLFFISKLFPKQKKICLESIIQNIQNIKMPYRIKFIKDYKKDVEQAGFLEYFSQILWQNKLYYSFFKLDYYLENRFSDNLNDLRIFRLALITAIKKNDKGLLRKLSGIYQQKGDYLKALKLYELVFDSIDKNFDNINSMIFLYEKNNMLWKAFKINLKVVFKNPVFFIKKNIIIVVKLFK